MFILSEQTWDFVSAVTKWLKYGFGGAATALSVLSLRYETTIKSDDPSQRKKLTDAGRWYQGAVLALAALTIATTIAGDMADSQLAKAADARHQEELKQALDGQLNNGFKPILDGLERQVETTSKSLGENLRKQSNKSTRAIEKQEKAVQEGIEQSSKAIDDLERNVADTATRTSSNLIEMQAAMLEANLRVTKFEIAISIPPKDGNHPPPYRRGADAELAALTKVECGPQGFTHSPDSDDPTNPCDASVLQERNWQSTHLFAERLFVRRGLDTRIDLNLSGVPIRFSVTDCGALIPGPAQPTLPCLFLAYMEVFEHSSDDPHDAKRVRTIVSPSGQAPKVGISIAYDSFRSNLLETRKLFARDLLMRGPLLLSVCSAQGGPGLNDDRIGEITEMLPESITVRISENETDEGVASVPVENRAVGQGGWTVHSLELHRAGPGAIPGCIQFAYRQ